MILNRLLVVLEMLAVLQNLDLDLDRLALDLAYLSGAFNLRNALAGLYV